MSNFLFHNNIQSIFQWYKVLCTLLILYSYKAKFIKKKPQKNTILDLSKSFNFTIRYIDDVMSLNNSYFSAKFREWWKIELILKYVILWLKLNLHTRRYKYIVEICVACLLLKSIQINTPRSTLRSIMLKQYNNPYIVINPLPTWGHGGQMVIKTGYHILIFTVLLFKKHLNCERIHVTLLINWIYYSLWIQYITLSIWFYRYWHKFCFW